MKSSLLLIALFLATTLAADTLEPLADGPAPNSVKAMWDGFDPRAEALDVEMLKAWEEDGVVLQVLRYRIGQFKGQTAKMAAVWGYPKGTEKLPGLVQIHGGGQYADYRAVLSNAKRGYATISIAWAGRIAAPGYTVAAPNVKLFWEGKTDHPQYKLTTDWGALDGYHAPSRNPGNHFPSANAAEWTLDAIESPRNSPWFLCALAARRALTFLERQPQVDPDRLGVYGHSMGGKLTVMTAAADSRVKAAAPSCGGISDRANKSALFCATVGDDAQLPHISCPIIFLSPANDFHGRINDLPRAVAEIASDSWRVTCAPHHNHQDTAAYEVATQLWFDQQLKGSFTWPATPRTQIKLDTTAKVPFFTVTPDNSQPVQRVEIFYTQQGLDGSVGDTREASINQFWHHAEAVRRGDSWHAHLHLFRTDKPLWVYANVSYALDAPVSGAGYYYGSYSSERFNVSSLIDMVSPEQLQAAGIRATLRPTRLIEDFGQDWQAEWFSYKPGWPRTTRKLNHPMWKAPAGAFLQLDVQAEQANTLVVGIDAYAAEVPLKGGAKETIRLRAADFWDVANEPLPSWEGIKELRLIDTEHLRQKDQNRRVGASWKGKSPVFHRLSWQLPAAVRAPQPDVRWTYKQANGRPLQLDTFLPANYASGERFPAILIFHGGSWQAGETNWHYPDCAYWSRRGLVAASVDYRLKDRDQVEVPLECVKDAKSAVRFLRANAERLKIDPDRIIVAGGSAGGQLAAATATITDPTSNDDSFELSISCKPNALILYNPWFKCADALNPIKHLSADLPPIITFSGGQDSGIPVSEMRAFHEVVKAAGGVASVYIGKAGKHGFCNGRNPHNPFFYWSLDLADHFLVKHGLLSGPSLVAAPQGVATLAPDDFLRFE